MTHTMPTLQRAPVEALRWLHVNSYYFTLIEQSQTPAAAALHFEQLSDEYHRLFQRELKQDMERYCR